MDTMVRTEKAFASGHFCHHFLPRFSFMVLFAWEVKSSLYVPCCHHPWISRKLRREKAVPKVIKVLRVKEKEAKASTKMVKVPFAARNGKCLYHFSYKLVLEGTWFQLFVTSLIGGGAGIFCLKATRLHQMVSEL